MTEGLQHLPVQSITSVDVCRYVTHGFTYDDYLTDLAKVPTRLSSHPACMQLSPKISHLRSYHHKHDIQSFVICLSCISCCAQHKCLAHAAC